MAAAIEKLPSQALKSYHLKPLIWKRFIDDIFLIWTHGENELRKFVEYLNTLHDTIKFTCEQSMYEIAFLDTQTKCTQAYTPNPQINTVICTIAQHTKKAVLKKGPFGQFLRLRRICHKNEDFIDESEK